MAPTWRQHSNLTKIPPKVNISESQILNINNSHIGSRNISRTCKAGFFNVQCYRIGCVFLYVFFLYFFNFYLYFLCASLSHLRHRLGAAPRPWPSEIGWSLSPTRGAISLEGIQGSTVGHSQGTGGSDSITANYR